MPNSNATLVRSYRGYVIVVTVRRDKTGRRLGRITCKPDRDAPVSGNPVKVFNGKMVLSDEQDIDDVWQWAQTTVGAILNQG